jgi:hypothetical protein
MSLSRKNLRQHSKRSTNLSLSRYRVVLAGVPEASTPIREDCSLFEASHDLHEHAQAFAGNFVGFVFMLLKIIQELHSPPLCL